MQPRTVKDTVKPLRTFGYFVCSFFLGQEINECFQFSTEHRVITWLPQLGPTAGAMHLGRWGGWSLTQCISISPVQTAS